MPWEWRVRMAPRNDQSPLGGERAFFVCEWVTRVLLFVPSCETGPGSRVLFRTTIFVDDPCDLFYRTGLCHLPQSSEFTATDVVRVGLEAALSMSS